MKEFTDVSSDGNEKALRRGSRVPDGAINLAWVKAPKLSPEKNIVMVDTSRMTDENTSNTTVSRKIMYANSLGILEDWDGNQVVEDEYPAIADIFTIDETFEDVLDKEYTADHILPYVHVSRYFHVDFVGLTIGSVAQSYRSEEIKVVDDNGREYVDDQGKPRYRISIAPARAEIESNEVNGAYRIWAFIDTDTNENLYLTYNKIEIATDGTLKNQDTDYKEVLNPFPYFSYRPEESDVIDPDNRKLKIYSTKPVAIKEQILDIPHPATDGYKVYVPKKAVEDPRIFQLFRWRVKCDFIERYQVDQTRSEIDVIKAGVLITNENLSISRPSKAPYAFYNMWKSDYNATNVDFINPLKGTTATDRAKQTASYWQVNLDRTSYSDLAKFDVLVWAMPNDTDLNKYIAPINYFCGTLGKTLIIDTYSDVYVSGMGITTTMGLVPGSGNRTTESGATGYVDGDTIRAADEDDDIWDAETNFGGWNFNDGTDDEYNTVSPLLNRAFSIIDDNENYSQYISDYPNDFEVILEGQNQSATYKPVLIRKNFNGGGNLFFSTCGTAAAVSTLFNYFNGKRRWHNRDAEISDDPNYLSDISGGGVEGAYKLFFNMCLLAVSNKIIDSSDREGYSTSWTFSSPWKASWVIKGDVLAERELSDYDFVPMTTSNSSDEPVWQRRLEARTLKEIIDSSLSADEKLKLNGADRVYTLETTNSKVQTSSQLGDLSYPFAWTEAYSPDFVVPAELGAHVIKEDPVQAEYEAGQYVSHSYPPKPYGFQVGSKFVTTSQHTQVDAITIRATGTVKKTTRPSGTPQSTDPVEITMSWATDGTNATYTSGRAFDRNVSGQPQGIRLYSEDNYYSFTYGTPLNWPFWGATVRVKSGDSGEWVSFLQDTLNVFKFLGMFNFSGDLKVDGKWGSVTQTAVGQFQTRFRHRVINNIVDAESWGIIGTLMAHIHPILPKHPNSSIQRKRDWCIQRVKKRQISDGLASSSFAKRSNVSGGPTTIWDAFSIELDNVYRIHAVTIVPYVEGNTKTIRVWSVDVLNKPINTFNLANYDAGKAMLSELNYRPKDGQLFKIPFTPVNGNVVVFGIGQDGPSGWGTSRMFGIRDLRIHASAINTPKPFTQVTTTVPVEYLKTITLSTGDIKTIKAEFNPSDVEKYAYSEIKWNDVEVISGDNMVVTISEDGNITLKSLFVENYEDTNFTYGPEIVKSSSATWYSMNENGVINPIQESGWITKIEGVKLLCDANLKPYGFPTMPTDMGAHETRRHYATIFLNSLNTDPSIMYGFYDRARKEFVTSRSGNPEMSYVEYMERNGPTNIFVGMICNYQVETKKPLPNADDAPLVPHKWAMPVYGVAQKIGAQIRMEPLPRGLGHSDVWSLPIRTGNFNKAVALRSQIDGPIAGYLKDYQGTTVRAFYKIIESELAGWSSIYGRPNVDVFAEHPEILDDNIIQVRQAPILLIREPAPVPTDADPVRPAMKIYVKDTPTSSWEQLSWSDIRDYNSSTGTIYLRNNLVSLDTNLIKVDYTSARPVYNFKQYDGNKLNLNPYPGHSRELIGKAIYVYIVPAYVKDIAGSIIASSVEDRTVRFTTDPSVFDTLSPNYDPLAVQLGVVYITTALDINELIILDTRRRGGGAKDSANADEIRRLVAESIGYWDIGFGSGMTYQKGGFIIVRLPVELKEQFPNERDVLRVIERNVPVGVQFKVEDLEGNDWS